MLTRPRIRQLGLGELLDETFRLYRNNFLTFVAIVALVMVPYSLLSFVVQYPLQDQLAELQNQANSGAPFVQGSPSQFFSQFLLWYAITLGVNLLYVVIVLPLLEGALAHAIAQRYLGRETSVGESFGAAIRHSPALIGARLIPLLIGVVVTGTLVGGVVLLMTLALGISFSDQFDPRAFGLMALLGLVVLGLFVLVSLIGLALFVRILFTSQAIMLEHVGPWTSLKRSWRLTQGYFWRTLGYWLVILLMMYVLLFIPGLVAYIPELILQIDPRVQFIISTCVGTVIGVMVMPFSFIAYTLMYYDLRIRKEGFDLEHQASALLAPGIGLSAFESR